jgi:hypothetical protein
LPNIDNFAITTHLPPRKEEVLTGESYERSGECCRRNQPANANIKQLDYRFEVSRKIPRTHARTSFPRT